MAASTPEVLEVPDLTLKSLEELWEDWKVSVVSTDDDGVGLCAAHGNASG